ncbi:3-ketoacyl-ACP reductase [bacterium]|nr:3-ketoacyl-ACP reductase [bacterium]
MSKVAVVTGGSRGIGRGIVLELARLGYRIAIHSRTGGVAAEEAARLAREAGAPEVVTFEADLAEIDAGVALAEAVFLTFGRCDVWVNNAGIAPQVRADLLEMTPESWDTVLATNLRGPFFLSQYVARRMMEIRDGSSAAQHHHVAGTDRTRSASGHIVFVTSVSSELASVARGEYCVSKAGLSMVAHLFAARLADEGIVVTEIRPGIIATDMTAGVREKYDRLMEAGLVPQRRWGTPEDVGRAVAAIARGDLDFSTGAVIHVDGGLTLGRL